MRYNKILILALAAMAYLSLSGCAKEKEESNNDIQERILEAFLQLNYPNAERTKSGLVILSHEKGTGGLFPANYQGVYLDYSTKNLNGEYLTTTNKEIAKKMGEFSPSRYYGPSLKTLGYGTISKGLHEALAMMNKDAKMTVIIPPYLTSSDNEYSSSGDGSQTSAVNVIYELNVKNVITDINQFQIDSLESFKRLRYPDIDSVVKGYYFKKTLSLGKDTIPADKQASVWYVGKLLDGYVFDTNIADTAKKYGIYDSSKEYRALEVSYKATYKDMTASSESSSDGNSYVEGFARTLKGLSYGERGISFFWSPMGYNTQTSGDIPAYSMLFFDVYIDPAK